MHSPKPNFVKLPFDKLEAVCCRIVRDNLTDKALGQWFARLNSNIYKRGFIKLTRGSKTIMIAQITEKEKQKLTELYELTI